MKLIERPGWSLNIWRDHMNVSRTERLPPEEGEGFITWYPFSLRWWKRRIYRWIDLGPVIRRSFRDEGKPRRLNRRDRQRYEQALREYQSQIAVATDQVRPQEERGKAYTHGRRAAETLAALGRKTYPRR